MNTAITSELNTTAQHLLEAPGLFSAADFNTIPFEGSWTAGQVTGHIFKSIKSVPQVITGPSLPAQRNPAQHVPNLRAMFLDFTTKMKSPDFILPSDEPKNYSTLTGQVSATLTEIIASSKTIDTHLMVVGFEFPGSGPVTRIELLNFISVHTQRHTHQLTEIAKYF